MLSRQPSPHRARVDFQCLRKGGLPSLAIKALADGEQFVWRHEAIIVRHALGRNALFVR